MCFLAEPESWKVVLVSCRPCISKTGHCWMSWLPPHSPQAVLGAGRIPQRVLAVPPVAEGGP